jgi:predicted transcriptional regulator YdeE
MYEIIERKAFKFVGISIRTTNINGQSAQDIGQLAEQFFSQQLAEKIPNRVDDALIFVYTDYESDQNAPYTTYIGCRVSSYKGVDSTFKRKQIKGGKYAVFKPVGRQPDVVLETWQRIWSGQDGLSRLYEADYDVYKGECVDVCLSIR